MPFGILGTGGAFPERVLTNQDLEKIVETSDEWIRSRSGIAERRIVDDGAQGSDLAAQAARRAMDMAGVEPGDIDCIIYATFGPDTLIPATACVLQNKLDIPNCPAFDVNIACSGWIYAMAVARGLYANGLFKRGLVVGGDLLTRFTDFEDRGTCVLFGDAMGAAVVGEVPEGRGVLAEYLGADGRLGENIIIPGGGSNKPASVQVVEGREQYIRMNGNEVFKFAVRIMHEALVEACRRAGVKPADLDWVVPHQANIRIIDSAVKRLKLPRERFIVNLERFGNTSAASVPLALDEAVRDERIQPGDLVGAVAFGGGLSWGAMVMRY